MQLFRSFMQVKYLTDFLWILEFNNWKGSLAEISMYFWVTVKPMPVSELQNYKIKSVVSFPQFFPILQDSFIFL